MYNVLNVSIWEYFQLFTNSRHFLHLYPGTTVRCVECNKCFFSPVYRYFSEVGEWEKVFNTGERTMIIYVGAAAMYVLGKVLKRR